MNIDCRDCGSDWCAKHEPVTREVFCPVKHKLQWLSESHAWCDMAHGHEVGLWTMDWTQDNSNGAALDKDGNSIPDLHMTVQHFESYQELNNWFISHVLNQEVAV